MKGLDDGSRPITGAKFDTLEDAQTGGSAQRSVEGWIILITGVHEEASEEDVSERCAEYGTVKNLHLNLDRQTGYIKGYALVEYETYQQAKAAIDSLNNSTLLEQPIKADFAFVNGPGGSKSVQESRKHRSSVDRRGSR
ncbi:RNA-binding domain-containing protein [Phlyctochytrium arcticum]|nr:RNA-binding domain-containing protein [Phlyctochytrium arcticum]